MFSVIFSLILQSLVLITPVHAGSGVSMDGGGGMEQILLYTWSNLETFTTPCLGSPQCYQTAEGRKVLEAISSTHQQELNNGGLKFVEQPGNLNIIQTQNQVGAPIQINLSVLYKKDLNLSLVEAMDFLLLGLEQHHPNHPDFTQTRANLKTFWSSRSEAWDLRKIGRAEIILMSIQQDELELLASSGEAYKNILPALTSQLKCLKDETAKLLNLKRVYWLDPEAIAKSDVNLSMYGSLQYNCHKSDGTFRKVSGEFKINFLAIVKDATAEEFLKTPQKYSLQMYIEKPRLQLFNLH